MDLVDAVYDLKLPDEELYVLSAQMRRAAISIPSNIAEGHGRFSLRDFRRFLREARASGLELETQILIAKRRRFISEQQAISLLRLVGEVSQLISGLIRYLSRLLIQSTKHKELTTKNGRQ